MTEEQKEKYLLLKNKNKENNENKNWENDVLYRECISVLSECTVLTYKDTKDIFLEFEKKYPISILGSINWNVFNGVIKKMSMTSLYTLENQDSKYFILWNKGGIPCVKSKLNTILKHIDDVLAVSFDTWLLSTNGMEIIEFHHEGRITYGKLL